MKDGNSVIVVTCGNVAQMVVAVVFGVVVLGERLPGRASGFFFVPFGKLGAWFASWSLILSGVVWISGVDFARDLPDQRALERQGAPPAERVSGLGGLGGSAAHRGHGRAQRANALAVAGARAESAAGRGQASGVTWLLSCIVASLSRK